MFKVFHKFVLLVAAAFLVCGPATAFSSAEHTWLSDTALDIALEYFTEENPLISESLARCPGLRDLVTPRCPCGDGTCVSYGEITAKADFFSNPLRLFKYEHNEKSEWIEGPVRIAEACADLNPSILNQSKFGLESFKASSSNDHHFQGDLLSTGVRLHERAIRYAEQGHLFHALVMNALADHFFQDFFAPGHMATLRENSHDAMALGIHDRANEIGALLKTGDWKKLKPIYDFLYRKYLRNGDMRFMGRTFRTLKLESVFLAPNSAEEVIAFFGDDKNSKESLPDLLITGDGSLEHMPIQSFYMLLVMTRSILDVLEAEEHYRGSVDSYGPVNNFGKYRWTGFFSEEAFVELATAGSYSVKDIKWKASNIFLFNVGGETPVSKYGSSRRSYSLEIAPLALLSMYPKVRDNFVAQSATECGLFTLCNVGVLIGYSHKDDASYHAYGPRLRLVKALPKIDMQFSVFLDELKFTTLSGRPKDWAYGVRWDSGFSFTSLYVEVGRSPKVIESQLDRGWSIGFGAGAGVPGARFKKIFRKFRRDKRLTEVEKPERLITRDDDK